MSDAAASPPPRARRAALALALPLLALSTVAAGAAGAQRPPRLPDCPADALPSSRPFFGVLVNGACTDLSSEIRRTSRTDPTWTLRSTLQTTVGTLDLRIDYDGDPFITFGTTTTNVVEGPVTYAFLFGTPIVPGSYNTAGSTAGLSVTTVPGAATTVTTSGIAARFLSGYGTVGAVPTNLGVDLGSAPCTAATNTTTCNYGSTSNVFAPTFYDNLEALLTYTQTTAGSVASWSGRVDLLDVQQVVPEPSTLGLLASGLGATVLAAAVRRRR